MNHNMVKKAKYTVGSLFAGIGGICRGFEQAGFQLLWANEFDKNAKITYESNFSHKFFPDDVHDLVNQKMSFLDKTDVITSGFPCQAFSIAGYRKGFEDSRGNLFFETMKIITSLKPKAFLLENVKNLIAHDNGRTFRVMEETIKDTGYSFIPKVLNTMEYGNIPQTRERIYIVGFQDESAWVRGDGSCSDNFSFPQKSELTKTVRRDILEQKKVDRKYYYTEKCGFYKVLNEQMKSKNTVYQWRRVYLRENKSGVCPTLTANMGTGGHNVPLVRDNYGIRKLTPRECARLQGFDDDFRLPDIASAHLYKQMGNSVSVPVIRRIAEKIRIALDMKYQNAAGSYRVQNVLEPAAG
ncbi:MAG TPA: DNA cytosine methyltransferase [Candidatus Omnitrophota bacterium]|nr:DNA cytosine methyltransferase [Candidatus Omnitrophota bacterium]